MIAGEMGRIKENMAEKGYHISIGCAMFDRDRGDEAIRESDRLMYEDKASFYQESGQTGVRGKEQKHETL